LSTDQLLRTDRMPALLRNNGRANDESANMLVIDQSMHILTRFRGLNFKRGADLEETYAITIIR
jgi:hypothetical protein